LEGVAVEARYFLYFARIARSWRDSHYFWTGFPLLAPLGDPAACIQACVLLGAIGYEAGFKGEARFAVLVVGRGRGGAERLPWHVGL